MTTPEDPSWLDPSELYLALGADCEIDRPIFQGDVFAEVPLPKLPNDPPAVGTHPIEFEPTVCMVVPHPCQCYHGDSVRPRLTVAPVREVQNYANFGEDMAGAKDKFALPDLPLGPGGSSVNCVADLGRLTTVHNRWLKPGQRIACLSHRGLGLLAKRVLGFQLRFPTTLANAMAYTAGEWNESFLMQAWVRRNGRLAGFTQWLRMPRVVAGVNNGQPVAPYDVRAGALDALLEAITGEVVREPGESE